MSTKMTIASGLGFHLYHEFGVVLILEVERPCGCITSVEVTREMANRLFNKEILEEIKRHEG